MKKIILATALFFGLSIFTTAQAQDSTGRGQNKSGTMKKTKASKKMKKNSRRTATDSTGNYGTMTNRNRRDSM